MASVVAAGRAPCAAATRRQHRRWRTTRTGSSRWSASGRIGRSKSSSRPCTSRECRAAAARSGVFWSVTTSASKKACARLSSNEPMSPGRAGIGSGSRPCSISSSLVFIDETWVTTPMAGRYGRCPRGERLIARVPLGTWKTLTFVAGLRCRRNDRAPRASKEP